MITGEGLKQAASLIQETNRRETIKYVCYDNGCHLEKHVNNIAYDYNEKTKAIKYFIDRFHLRNHKTECTKYSWDNDIIVRLVNSSVCEQLF